MNALLLTLSMLLPVTPRPPPPPVRSDTVLVVELCGGVARPAAGRFLTIAEVARVVEDPQGVWPLVSGTFVADGNLDWVGWTRVLHRLRGCGLDSSRIRLRGPAFFEWNDGGQP